MNTAHPSKYINCPWKSYWPPLSACDYSGEEAHAFVEIQFVFVIEVLEALVSDIEATLEAEDSFSALPVLAPYALARHLVAAS